MEAGALQCFLNYLFCGNPYWIKALLGKLRWFPSLHCAFLLRTISASLARANERAGVQNVRDFPQTKLDSVINARVLLNELGDPHFLFYKFNKNNILNNWEKQIGRNPWLLFWQMK